MSGEARCRRFAELAPELALGIATGEERAAALAHASGCPDCRRLLTELSSTADALLLLGPTREPPPGFETQVLERLPVRHRRRRLAAVAAAVVLAATLAGTGTWAGTWAATRDDREVAGAYRQTLARAQGSYFTAYQLYDERADRRVGTVFGYQGATSWVFMTVDRAIGTGPFSCSLLLSDGSTVPLGTFTLDRTQSWGRTVDTDLRHVTTLRLRDLTTGQTFESEFRR